MAWKTIRPCRKRQSSQAICSRTDDAGDRTPLRRTDGSIEPRVAQTSVLKLLLVGPFPPPHGGVSVHVVTLQDRLQKAGIPCRVLNIGRGTPKSDRYVSIKGPVHFIFLLSRYSLT